MGLGDEGGGAAQTFYNFRGKLKDLDVEETDYVKLICLTVNGNVKVKRRSFVYKDSIKVFSPG